VVKVPWRPLDVTEGEVAEAEKRFRKKARFLTDQDVHSETAPFLRTHRWNVKTAQEVGLTGHDDSDLMAFAQREDRLLLTHDRDYLSDRKFPPARKGGVVILPGGAGDIRALVQALLDMLAIVAPYWNAYRGSKIVFNSDRTLSIRSRDSSSGAITTTRYRLRPHATPEMWTDD